LRFNEKYAAKLEKKLAKKRAQEKAKADVEAAKNKMATMSNPFSVRKCFFSWTTGYSYFHIDAAVFCSKSVWFWDPDIQQCLVRTNYISSGRGCRSE
jgi:hypothetical protein